MIKFVGIVLLVYFIHLSSCQLIPPQSLPPDCFGEGPPTRPNSQLLAKGSDSFGINLFKDIALDHPHNSLVLSPFSVWSVLILAYLGARGNTERELQTSLEVPSKSDVFYGRPVIDARLKLNLGTIFNKADYGYFDHDLVLRRCVLDKVVDVANVDFKNSQETAKRINNDVSEATGGKIRNFLSASIISKARFILINAVYFKGLWKFPFNDRSTMKLPFYDETHKIKTSVTDMMTIQAKFNYVHLDILDASVLELPYENSNISMIIILPSIQSTVNEVLKKISSNILDDVSREFRINTVLVSLPKFNMTTRIAKELKTALKHLGINDLFIHGRCDLSDFIPNEKVAVDDSLHHATIEVNEEGTVAAAVTALIGTRSGSSRNINFNADKPFIFLIRDMSQGLTLFMGVYRNPDHTTPK